MTYLPTFATICTCKLFTKGGIIFPLERIFDVIFDAFVDHRRVRESRDVTEIVGMSGGNFSKDSSHDFARTGLGEAGTKLKIAS